MRVFQIHIRNFRGFRDLSFAPNGHVVLVGEPGAGRSDLIEGLRRVLTPDSTRFPLNEPLDFHAGNLNQRAEVEIVLGEFRDVLEQRFIDYLEVWDSDRREVIPELDNVDRLGEPQHSWVLRLCYRAEWDPEDKQGRHWVDFPKYSDPEKGLFEQARRPLREELPFALVQPSTRPLDLSARATFRQVVDRAEGGDFPQSLDKLTEGLGNLAQELSKGSQVSNALDQVLLAIRARIGLEGPGADAIRFMPEGGSLGATIRSLSAAVDLSDGAGILPLARHGSTLRALLAVSEALFSMGEDRGVVVADDFGEDLDLASARHLAAWLRLRSGQVWLSTRRSAAAEAFEPEEVVRLTRTTGVRLLFQGHRPTNKAERIAAHHRFRQLLPEAASRGLIVVEGPHDRAAMEALARRLFSEGVGLLPAARGLSIIDAGAVDSSGGITAIPRLTAAAHRLGFRTVAVIDWDRDAGMAAERLSTAQAATDCVIRLPQDMAVELALLEGLGDQVVSDALRDVVVAMNLQVDPRIFQMAGRELRREAIKVLKKTGGGLHAEFIEALPSGVYPPVLRQALDCAVQEAVGTTLGLVQL